MNPDDINFIMTDFATSVGLKLSQIGLKIRNTAYTRVFNTILTNSNLTQYIDTMENYVATSCNVGVGDVAVNLQATSNTTLTIYIFVTGAGVDNGCLDGFDPYNFTQQSLRVINQTIGTQLIEIDINIPTSDPTLCPDLKTQLNNTMYKHVDPKDISVVGNSSASKYDRNPLKGYTVYGASSNQYVSDTPQASAGVVMPIASGVVVLGIVGGVATTSFLNYKRSMKRLAKQDMS